ncbi:PQQ-binding-like beta-propeller repeat protein [Mucilaginibacter sp.]|uniref:outer membrane protein assembly factor BamB family protein n=1 Tax=Mucilaginibacter sp. TaxID=1882438 RepID=UPI00260FA708|nr:PQQ-binding-like beta-propeller repeat protein [Mucilaginibacter sp.]MDB5032167.1 quinoprotein glucose dehydrogenase [Mucilaginibacter sp.]
MNFKKIKLSPVRIWGTVATIVLVAIAICFGCMTKKAIYANSNYVDPYTNWREYGGGPDQSKYTTLNQITKKNVNQLQVAWTYSTGDNVSSYKFNPLIVDNVMYVLAKNNSLVALDATNGKEIWIHTGLNTASKRGMNYWESKDRKDRRLIFCMNNTLQEIDAQTGKSILTFGTNGAVNLREGLDRDPEAMTRVTSTSPGAIYDDLILLGSSPGESTFSPPGHLRAYNVVTGKMAWIFHTIPLPGEPGYETWPKDAYKYVGGVNTWGEISIDVKRGIAYFPLGAPTYDYYGADRIGKGLYGDCILALDARTGKHIWHFQMVHHDLWDFDAAAAPQLVTVTHNGQKVDAVAQATKQGFLFVFNRVTGEPLWPIDEKPVPKSTMPDEESWPTQPVPTVVPPFSRQVVTVDDINPYFTAAEKETWRKRILAAHSGLFEPLSDKYETITMPGANGGAIHGNTAANPVKGYVYVSYQDKPSVYRLKKVEPAELRIPLSADETERAKALYVQNCQTCHGVDHTGGLGPNLVDINNRVNFDNFKTIVSTGRALMPSFLHLGDQNVTAIYKFLSSAASQRGGGAGARGGRGDFQATDVTKIDGPVVASGGAPGGEEFQKMPTKPMRDYPAGVTPPKEKYTDGSTTSYGLGYPNLLSPPWSAIAAYDLNTGKIKWKRALGNDDKLGGKDTGLPVGSQHKGMIVTSTGIIFATCLDGRIYAYDEDNGNLLWQVKLPRVPDGLPTMYQVNGKQYMAICSVSDQIDKSKPNAEVPRQYIVFALPSKK